MAVFDARPKLNAQANKLKGGGFEDTNHYQNIDFQFCYIENIHAVTKAFEKMQDIPQIQGAFNDEKKYGTLVQNSGYLQFLQTILVATNQIVDNILNK